MNPKDWISLYLVLVVCRMGVQTKRLRMRTPRLLKGLPEEWHRLRNLSSIPGTFPCSEEERSCFKYGRLLHIEFNEVTNRTEHKCYPVGERGPCGEGSLFHVDVAEATRRGGRLRGTCQFPCGYSFRTKLRESDGRCLWKRELQEKLCGSHLGRPARVGQTTTRVWGRGRQHNGQWECECSGPPCPKQPPLPHADGSCVAPDLANPAQAPKSQLQIPSRFLCTDKERNCIVNIHRVFYSGQCYDSLSQGPCANGEWLISYSRNPLAPRCTKRPCPEGQLPYAGKCISEDEIRTHLCTDMWIEKDPLTGEWGCTRGGTHYYLIHEDYVCSNSKCSLCSYDKQLPFALGHLEIECARNDLGLCALSVLSQSPVLAPILLEMED